MGEKLEYIRVRVYKIMYPGRDVDYIDGRPSYRGDFITKLQEEDALFREPIITFINDAVGTHNWAVYFAEFIENKKFDVHIYCDSDDDYFKIVDIIRERITQFEFTYFPRQGQLADYMRNQ